MCRTGGGGVERGRERDDENFQRVVLAPQGSEEGAERASMYRRVHVFGTKLARQIRLVSGDENTSKTCPYINLHTKRTQTNRARFAIKSHRDDFNGLVARVYYPLRLCTDVLGVVCAVLNERLRVVDESPVLHED